MSNHMTVTPAEVSAARLQIKLATRLGQSIEPAVRAIAEARPVAFASLTEAAEGDPSSGTPRSNTNSAESEPLAGRTYCRVESIKVPNSEIATDAGSSERIHVTSPTTGHIVDGRPAYIRATRDDSGSRWILIEVAYPAAPRLANTDPERA